MSRFGRQSAPPVTIATGWNIARLINPTKLLGANGMRIGPDQRLYIAQAIGSQISALDLTTNSVETVVNVGDGIWEPDDLAFDARGSLYATEIMEGRVSVRRPNGRVEVLAGNLTGANGIAIHGERIFVDECRPNGRMWELSPSGGAPRLIASDLPAPNALCLGPDDYIYFPVIFSDEIWRVRAAGGIPERFVGGIRAPVAVKFDSKDRLVTVSSASGDVLRFDLPSRAQEKLGHTRPGIDNFELGQGDRLFVSHFTDGGISEILSNGSERVLVEPALLGPWGIAFDRNGDLIVADGIGINRCTLEGVSSGVVNMLNDHGFPLYARNLVILADGTYLVADSRGTLTQFSPFAISKPLASGIGQITGMALQGDAVIVCVSDVGRVLRVINDKIEVLASGLGRSTGLAISDRGELLVGDAASGDVVQIDNGRNKVIAKGFLQPEGMVVIGRSVFVADRAQRAIFEIDIDLGTKNAIAKNLPFGAPPGVTPRIMPGIPGLVTGPILPFTGLVSDGHGNLYASADGEGSIIKLSREAQRQRS